MVVSKKEIEKALHPGRVEPGGTVAPVHPGEVLREQFMQPLALSANALAKALHVPTNRITGIINEQRGVTADTALRLARYFGGSAEFWLKLQKDYELRLALRDSMPRIAREVSPRRA